MYVVNGTILKKKMITSLALATIMINKFSILLMWYVVLDLNVLLMVRERCLCYR